MHFFSSRGRTIEYFVGQVCQLGLVVAQNSRCSVREKSAELVLLELEPRWSFSPQVGLRAGMKPEPAAERPDV